MPLCDLEDVYEYIAADSPKDAVKFIDLIESKCAALAQSPLMGQLRPELRDDVRSFPVQRYLIFYRVLLDDEVVEIVHVFHGALDMEKLF